MCSNQQRARHCECANGLWPTECPDRLTLRMRGHNPIPIPAQPCRRVNRNLAGCRPGGCTPLQQNHPAWHSILQTKHTQKSTHLAGHRRGGCAPLPPRRRPNQNFLIENRRPQHIHSCARTWQAVDQVDAPDLNRAAARLLAAPLQVARPLEQQVPRRDQRQVGKRLQRNLGGWGR